MLLRIVVCALAGALLSTTTTVAAEVDKLAESYVKLVLAMGQHDADYVDAFYGPKEWKEAAEKAKKTADGDRGRGAEVIG
jgi:hypothetical protein